MANAGIMQALIDESEVRDLGLSFLRQYYKFWPRTTDIELRRNLRAEGGLVIDGLLSFGKPGGEVHQIALEATDFQHREELWFTVLWPLAAWDAGALASVVGAGTFLFLQLSNRLAWMHAHPMWFALTLLSAAGLLTVLVYRMLYPLKRYRYIHAIEQFRQYDAEAQWIAFSWDVFPGYDSPPFKELHAQCIATGTGLLEIKPDKSVKPHITPSREQVIGTPKRRVVRFFQDTEWAKMVRQMTRGTHWRAWLGAQLHRVSGFSSLGEFVRFPRPVWKQLGIGLFSTFLIALTIWLEYLKRPVHYVNEKKYGEKMLAFGKELSPTGDPDYLPLLPDSSEWTPYQKDTKPYLDIVPDSINRSPDQSATGLLEWKKDRFWVYPCPAVVRLLEGKFGVIAGDFYEEASAMKMVRRLKEQQVGVKALFLGCFYPRKGYFVLLDEQVFTSLEEANQQAAQLRALLKKEGIGLDVQVLFFGN